MHEQEALHYYSTLKNTYFVVRHGQSIPNVKGIIVSDPSAGCNPGNGLTDLGKTQACEAGKRLLELINELNNGVVIVSSDFSRVAQTAVLIKDEIYEKVNTIEIVYSIELRERLFGVLEGTTNENYEKAWKADQITDIPIDAIPGVEHVVQVYKRACNVINQCESKYVNMNIVLVSHGDVLQILLSGILLRNPHLHRSIAHLNVAEVRQLFK